eukprot:GHRQ01036882.1.p2 GENE.GHRQ01036882.1~~GHRQ01036882.1.p2  ORF type:complete len:128 (-),score=36.44 GHRQ01036882.1:570-914(-)
MSIVMFSTAVPGAPAIATPPEVFQELFQVCEDSKHCSPFSQGRCRHPCDMGHVSPGCLSVLSWDVFGAAVVPEGQPTCKRRVRCLVDSPVFSAPVAQELATLWWATEAFTRGLL